MQPTQECPPVAHIKARTVPYPLLSLLRVCIAHQMYSTYVPKEAHGHMLPNFSTNVAQPKTANLKHYEIFWAPIYNPAAWF